MKDEGVLEKSSYERYSAKANVKAKIKPWLDVTLDVNASRGIGKGIGNLEMAGHNPLWIAFNSSPTMEMFDKNGNYQNDPYGTIQENADSVLAGSESERREDVLNGRIRLEVQPCQRAYLYYNEWCGLL